jgi:hypothetical protein
MARRSIRRHSHYLLVTGQASRGLRLQNEARPGNAAAGGLVRILTGDYIYSALVKLTVLCIYLPRTYHFFRDAESAKLKLIAYMASDTGLSPDK